MLGDVLCLLLISNFFVSPCIASEALPTNEAVRETLGEPADPTKNEEALKISSNETLALNEKDVQRGKS